jgi:hypothetical protein
MKKIFILITVIISLFGFTSTAYAFTDDASAIASVNDLPTPSGDSLNNYPYILVIRDNYHNLHQIYVLDKPVYLTNTGTNLQLKTDGGGYIQNSSFAETRWSNGSLGLKKTASVGSIKLVSSIPATFDILYTTYDVMMDTGETYYDWVGNNGPIVSVLKPTGSYETGMNITVPYDVGLTNLTNKGNLVIGIDKNIVVGRQNIIEKTIPVTDLTKLSYVGGFNINLEKSAYIFYAKYRYNNGTEDKEVVTEMNFNGGINENQLNGQDVVTGNDSYNKILKFTSPVSGQLYDYGLPQSYTITADKTFYDTETKMPLEQYLPPIPEKTGYYQQDAIALEARGMVYIIQNNQINDSLKVSLQEFYLNDVTKNFPWYKNNGMASEGQNDIALVSVLSSQNKTSFYNYYVGNAWHHIYAGSQYYIGNEETGIINPDVPVIGGKNIPVRGDYQDNVFGLLQYVLDSILTMLTLPFQFIGSLFSSVTSFIGTSITWFGDSNHGVIGFITAVFGFMPPEVRTIISGLLSFIAIFSIYKLIRR